MQSRSATWMALAAGGTARLEAAAVIAGTEYAGISAPAIERALMQDGLSVGNAVAASCRFSVMDAGTIPKAARVELRMRLTDGETASEWLPAGTYFVAHRSLDKVSGLLTLECYDALLKANAVYQAPAGATWPRAMAAVAAELAEALGLALDGRTTLRSGDAYRVTEPRAGATIRDILSGIAAVHGGNWIVTPGNRLRLVPVRSAAGAASASEDAVDIAGVTGGVSAAAAGTVTGLRYAYGDGEEEILMGDETGVVAAARSPYFNAENLEALYAMLRGMTYQSFELKGAIYDPAAELGDYVRSREDVAGVLNGESASLGAAFRGNLSSPEPGELADEYPYIGGAKQALRLLAEAVEDAGEKAEDAEAAVSALDSALNQREIFNRLTNNGQAQGIYLKDGKLYINGTYIDTGTLDADLIATGIITDASGDNYWDLDGGRLVTGQGVIGDFTLAGGTLQYGSTASGSTGASVGKDGIAYSRPYAATGDTPMTRMVGHGLEFHWNGVEKFLLFLSDGDLSVRSRDGNGDYDYPMTIYNQGDGNIYFRRNLFVADGHNLAVSGTMSANRVTSAEPFGVDSGGTGLSASPSMLVNLGSTGAADVFQASPRPGIVGTLQVGHGGTGANVAADARRNLGIRAGTLTATFTNGQAGLAFSNFGITARPTCVIATPADAAGAIVTYNYSLSTMQVVLNCVKDGANYSGSLRLSFAIIG